MTGTASDVTVRIAALGFGSLTNPVTIFVGELPPSPDDIVTVKELTGSGPARSMGGVVLDLPDIQVIVRRKAYADLVTTVTGIRGNGQNPSPSGLDGWHGTLNGRDYLYMSLAYEPVYLGRDENNRRQVSLVFNVMRRR